jgi:predicted  nucleic acid-binding Zn-ribbon protein
MSFSDIEETEWTKDEIQRLIELQNLDRGILALREEMKVYPAMLREWDVRLQQKKRLLEEATQSRQDTTHERRTLEHTIKEKEERIRKFLQHQAEVRTNKEYQALTHEIDTVRQEIDGLEDRLLEIFSLEEAGEARLRHTQEEYGQLEGEASRERQRIEAELHSKRAALNEVKQRRDGVARGIPGRLLFYYEEMFKKYPGSVVVDVKNGSCGGCYMQILPQVLVEVRQPGIVRACHRCLRLVVWDMVNAEKTEDKQ